MRINISIEARMTSSRLPGKVLKSIKGVPALEIMIGRVKQSKLFDKIIVATTINKEDDEIVNWCKKNNIDYFRGSENNVYDRVWQTHKKFKTDIIVELTGDCPLLDPSLIDKGIDIFLNNDYDYVSTGRSYPIGMAVEIFSFKDLQNISVNRELTYEDKEHVSPYFYTSGKYKVFHFEAPMDLTMPELSVTLDTIEDYNMIETVCKNFDDFDFSLKDIIGFIKSNPDLLNINQAIHRKGLE
jgi:spore coat polysaccharide biosynthesis protein SpsF